MEKEIKPEVTSEILSSAMVDTTSEVHLNEINEFSFSEPQPHDGFMDCAGGMYVTNLKLEMDEEVKPELISENALAAIVNSTSDVSCLNEVKNEFFFPESQPYGGFEEHAVVKHEDTSIQPLNHQIKSENLDLKCVGISSDNDDVDIKPEPSVSEELHIENEAEENFADQTVKRSTKAGHLYCGVCNSKFASKSSLQRHLDIHTGEKPFQCDICDFKCLRKSSLKQHNINTHTGKKSHKCSICDYKCIQKGNLQRHMLKHTGEKPFKCNQCNYRCLWKCNLQHHMKTHTGEYLQCNMCVYKCILKSTLERHIKTHTGEKPFRCNVCDYRSIRNSHLQRHMKRHVGKQTISV